MPLQRDSRLLILCIKCLSVPVFSMYVRRVWFDLKVKVNRSPSLAIQPRGRGPSFKLYALQPRFRASSSLILKRQVTHYNNPKVLAEVRDADKTAIDDRS